MSNENNKKEKKNGFIHVTLRTFKMNKGLNSEYCGRIFVNPSVTVFSFISEYQMIYIAFIGIRNQVGVLRLET